MKDLNALFSEAIHYHQQGLFTEARSRYLEILEILPDNINVLGNMGLLCRDLGELEEALNYGRRTVEAAPDDPAQHINLGAIHEALARTAEARGCYERALALCPSHPKALNNLGKLLHLMGDSDQGLELLRKSVAIEPTSHLALNNLGVVLSARGDTRAAIIYIERSLQLAPNAIETLYNLAGLYNCEGEYERAAELLERLLALSPGHGSAAHMLAALRGTVTDTAPSQYVTETFDRYAGRFDHHIQEVLGYTVPAALAEMTAVLAPARKFRHGLDLGCGTGLSGRPFAGLAEKLTGVDLSPRMLLRAGEKGVYTRLECADIITFLDSDNGNYDLIIAADVFIYLGRLEPFFSRLNQRAAPGTVLACSVERFSGSGDYTLQISGRYAHAGQYLRNLATSAGYTLLGHREHDIRKENNSWIPGDLYLFGK